MNPFAKRHAVQTIRMGLAGLPVVKEYDHLLFYKQRINTESRDPAFEHRRVDNELARLKANPNVVDYIAAYGEENALHKPLWDWLNEDPKREELFRTISGKRPSKTRDRLVEKLKSL